MARRGFLDPKTVKCKHNVIIGTGCKDCKLDNEKRQKSYTDKDKEWDEWLHSTPGHR